MGELLLKRGSERAQVSRLLVILNDPAAGERALDTVLQLAPSPRTNWYAKAPIPGTEQWCGDVEPERVRSPETSAGPSERAGFIEAPEIGPPNIASRPTVAADCDRRRLANGAGVGCDGQGQYPPANSAANVTTASAATNARTSAPAT